MPPRSPVSACSFVYPWDLADMGVEAALERFREDGFEALDLTVCYHPITAFTPSPGRRLMMFDDGGVFFPARAERYGRIKPKLWPERDVLNAWPRVAELAGDLRLNGWTIGMYQPWIAAAYPDCARVLPTGQEIPSAVCPSSADVREFVATIAGDLASQFPVAMIQLEGITSLRFDAGWRVGRILVDLTEWQRWLLSICFCPSCSARGRAENVDVEGLRARIQHELERGYALNGLDQGQARDELHSSWLERDADYGAYLPLRVAASVELLQGVADALHASSPSTQIAVWAPTDFDGTMLDLDRSLPLVHAIQSRNPGLAPEATAEARRVADAFDVRLRTVHWCGGYIGPSFGPEFERGLQAAVELPVDEINVFNWGMLSPSISRRIVPLLRDLEAAAAA